MFYFRIIYIILHICTHIYITLTSPLTKICSELQPSNAKFVVDYLQLKEKEWRRPTKKKENMRRTRPVSVTPNFFSRVIIWDNFGIIFFFLFKTIKPYHSSYLSHNFHLFILKENHHKHQMRKLESDLNFNINQ